MSYHSRAKAKEQFQRSYDTQLSGGATQAMLSRVLRSNDLVGWSTREESGRLDRRGLTRFATGEANVFSRRTSKEAERSAVYVLIDCSGSMHGCMAEVQNVSVQLSKMLERARASFTVRGFNGHGDVVKNKDNDYRRTIELVTQIRFKDWHESLNKASLKMGVIHECADSSTPDFSGLYFAIEELSKQPEAKKVLFFITDADGYDKSNMKHLEALAEKFGIKIVALGINSDQVEETFKHSANINDVSELGGSSFKTLLNTMR
jgi:cobalamin biosynthesis protein CobT